MLQPFIKFESAYIERLKKLNKTFLVSQTYTRGFDPLQEDHPIDILFTDYDDPGLAKTHLNALKGDNFACLLNLNNETHCGKIREMVSGAKYEVYWAVVQGPTELKKRVELKYTDNIRQYISKNTNWRIGANETISPSLQVIFGELFMILKYGSQTLRIKFADLEKR